MWIPCFIPLYSPLNLYLIILWILDFKYILLLLLLLSELLTDVGKRILLFEKQSSRKSSRSSHLRRSLHKHELKKIALHYEQKLNDLAIKIEKALVEVKQRFRCESDNLEHVTEINLSTTTSNHHVADCNKDSDKLVDQSDNLNCEHWFNSKQLLRMVSPHCIERGR